MLRCMSSRRTTHAEVKIKTNENLVALLWFSYLSIRSIPDEKEEVK